MQVVGAYPELRLTDDQLDELGRLSEPRLPIMDCTNALPNTLLAVDGEQFTVCVYMAVNLFTVLVYRISRNFCQEKIFANFAIYSYW